MIQQTVCDQIYCQCKQECHAAGEQIRGRVYRYRKIDGRHLQYTGQKSAEKSSNRKSKQNTDNRKDQCFLVDIGMDFFIKNPSTLMVASSRSRSEIFVVASVKSTTNASPAASAVTRTTTQLINPKDLENSSRIACTLLQDTTSLSLESWSA